MDPEVSGANASDRAVTPHGCIGSARHPVHRHVAALVADDALRRLHLGAGHRPRHRLHRLNGRPSDRHHGRSSHHVEPPMQRSVMGHRYPSSTLSVSWLRLGSLRGFRRPDGWRDGVQTVMGTGWATVTKGSGRSHPDRMRGESGSSPNPERSGGREITLT